ncbi:membrane protein YdbS with pleckstrin-like domain [Metabacillus crassostreae]|uniref:PH domain-containing protein n=1 Tax=Metabacillus crassostreae TaxID=929098 RepID=UPI0019583FD5|nr:PH domain-containing protein [Metabacillus crassostreae]MBM7605145.1 membrane protein YdbS with pleckstrin-like domain [Metabacillus crassostreae]
MYIEIDEPTEQISKYAVKVWRTSNTIGHTLTLIIIAILILCTMKFDWYEWIGIVLYALGGIIVISAVFSILIEPAYLQQTWRYKVDPQFIQLKHGKWQVVHTLIPMEKVEYVRTEQGPLMRRYQLYNVEIGTTASSHVIPAIPAKTARNLKFQIAAWAKLQDQDSNEGEKGA